MEEMFDSNGEKTEDMIKGLTEAVNQLSEKVDTIAAGDLKSMLPVEIAGMVREGYSASKKVLKDLVLLMLIQSLLRKTVVAR